MRRTEIYRNRNILCTVLGLQSNQPNTTRPFQIIFSLRRGRKKKAEICATRLRAHHRAVLRYAQLCTGEMVVIYVPGF